MEKADSERTICISQTPTPVESAGPFFLVMNGVHCGSELTIPKGASIIGREGVGLSLGNWDDAISRNHAQVMRAAEEVTIIDLSSTNGIFINDRKVETAALDHGNLLLVGRTILKFINQRDSEAGKLKDVLRQAVTDGLTGIYNRRYFMERYEGEYAWSKKRKVPLGLVMIDMDHFKEFNDAHGHLTGDEVLIQAARLIQAVLKDGDVLARYGGEEFIVMLPGRDLEKARETAEEIRRAIEKARIVHRGTVLSITVSLGVAALLPEIGAPEPPEELLKSADDRLFLAKRAGRNCCR